MSDDALSLQAVWMSEPSVSADELMSAVGRVLEKRRRELTVLERDTTKLESVQAPFPRISYDDAVRTLNEKGLPERPWFKNQIYAPGAYTGYGAKPVAAIREYMDEKKWAEADAQIPMVAHVIENIAGGINKAAKDLEAATSAK